MGILFVGKGQIGSLHTNAAYARRGFGRRMVDHLLAVARERGLKEVFVEASLLAVPLYVSAGFEKIREEQHLIARGQLRTEVVFRKSLQ